MIEGLRRSRRPPFELVVVQMGGAVFEPPPADFPIRIERIDTDGLPLAAARNRAALRAQGEALVFLDVDCIPMSDCLGRLADELHRCDALLCADVRYLGPNDARGSWSEPDLLRRGRPHPLRTFPADGVRPEPNPGLFWSLAFAIRRATFERLGGFDESFQGYGAEDTDFGFRAVAMGAPLLFVGGALACHQHHEGHDPPVQHLGDIVRNARRFHAKWGCWPMEGWLGAFATMGLIHWSGDDIAVKRSATLEEVAATRAPSPADLAADLADRKSVSQVHAA
jgi:hypothetical protein